MRARFAALGVALAFVACGARTALYDPEDASLPIDASHDAVHDVHDAALDAFDAPDVPPSSPLCASPDAGAPTTVCTRDVHVGAITLSMSTCFVDTIVHEGDDGFVNFSCNGDPSTWADAKFAKGEFLGSVNGTTVDLCTGTTFPWSDGCTWASAQRITGNLDSGTLSFTYEETPIEGGPCEPPCNAQGTILVQ